MPVITVEAGPIPAEQKKQLIEGLTKTASQIMGAPESHYTVFLHENSLDNIGVAGQVLSEKED